MAEEERGRRENSDETCAHLKSCRVSVAKMVVVVSEGGVEMLESPAVMSLPGKPPAPGLDYHLQTLGVQSHSPWNTVSWGDQLHGPAVPLGCQANLQ